MAKFEYTPEAVAEMPSTGSGRKADNPAIPVVKAALNKGAQRITVGKANVSRVRGQLNRAATSADLKIRTRNPKDEPDAIYFEVTEKAGG